MKALLSLPSELHQSGFETHVMGLMKSLWWCEIVNTEDEAVNAHGWKGEVRLFDLICDCEVAIFVPHRYNYDRDQKWMMKVCYRLKKEVYFSDGTCLIQVGEVYALSEQ